MFYNFGNALYNADYFNLNLNDYELPTPKQSKYMRVAYTTRQAAERKQRTTTGATRSSCCSVRRLIAQSLKKAASLR